MALGPTPVFLLVYVYGEMPGALPSPRRASPPSVHAPLGQVDRLHIFAGRAFLTAFGAALVMLRRVVERGPRSG